MTPTEEAISYFKGRAGFSRLFLKFADRIESLGGVGGTATLANLTEQEKVVLRNWFQKDYATKKSAQISLKKFEDKFHDTKFEGASLFDVVEGVIGRKLVFKKDKQYESETLKKRFFEELRDKYSTTYTSILTASILAKDSLTSGFTAAYNRNEFNGIEKIYKALSMLPLDKPLRLPLFAEQVTGNPHALDNDSKLISALQLIKAELHGGEIQKSLNAEYINQLLFEFGIMKDDISNYVSLYGFIGERNEQKLGSWQESFKEGSVRNEPLREIVKLDKIYPIKKGSPVFVLENSGVFSSVIDEIEGLPVSVICTHGQIKLAAFQVIKKLVEQGCQIYYSGDFDPEGISIACSLARRYPKNVHYWRYSVEDYLNSLSEVELDPSRLQKLNNIQEERLSLLLKQILATRKAAYQEKQMKTLIQDIKASVIPSP